jgi:hypothetical protein
LVIHSRGSKEKGEGNFVDMSVSKRMHTSLLPEVRAFGDSRRRHLFMNSQYVLDTVAGHAINVFKSDGCGVF